MTSVKDTITELKGTDADWAKLIEQEKAGDNRKSLLGWLETQAENEPLSPPVDASAPVEPVYVEPSTIPTLKGQVDTIEGGEIPINDLIAELSQKRDRWRRSRGCGLEDIIVHLGDLHITVR